MKIFLLLFFLVLLMVTLGCVSVSDNLNLPEGADTAETEDLNAISIEEEGDSGEIITSSLVFFEPIRELRLTP